MIQYLLADAGYRVDAFHKVGELPLEIDIIVIEESRKRKRQLDRLLILFKHLNRYTVIEYKSPKDTLEFGDFDLLRAYALLYKRQQKIKHDKEITILTISSKITRSYKTNFEANGRALEEIEQGVYSLTRELETPFKYVAIELDKIPVGSKNGLLLLFSGMDEKSIARALARDERDLEIVTYLFQNVFQKEVRQMKFNIKEMQEIRKKMSNIHEMFVDEMLPKLKPEELLKSLTRQQKKRLRKLLESEE